MLLGPQFRMLGVRGGPVVAGSWRAVLPWRATPWRAAPSRAATTQQWLPGARHFSVGRRRAAPTQGGSSGGGTKGGTGGTGDLRRQFGKLLQLVRPEFRLLAAALACLVVTSAVSMSLPLFIGKIIDTARPGAGLASIFDQLTGRGEGEGAGASEPPAAAATHDDEATILGLPASQFYPCLLAFFTVGAAANFGRSYLLRSVGESLVARLRLRLFAKILSQDSYFFDGTPSRPPMKTGDLILRILADTQIISKTLSSNILDGCRAAVSGLVGMSMMCYVSWQLTLCMSLMFPPLILMLMVYGRRIKQLARKVQDNLGALTKVLEEKLNGLSTIQLFAQQQLVVHDFNHEVRTIYNTSMQEGRLSAFYYGGNGFLGNTTLLALLVLGTQFINSGAITLGDLSLFMMYALYTGLLVFGLGNFYTELMKGVGALERVFELIELKPTITTSLGKKVDSLHGDIDFRECRFAYPARPSQQIFPDLLNLHITRGDHLCLVGPLGSGKSTILQLLLRFYDPLSGSITVNGHDIRDLNLNYYRANIGYVQQDPLLFSGTIRDNILFGLNHLKHVDDREAAVIEAAKLSNSYDFIMQFPEKFDTVLGARGSTQLLGGQRQRVLLARTLIKKPDILILDEATSALDSRSEEIVMQNLMRWSRERHMTIILIAHRLLTIKNSEHIIVFDSAGRIVEQGEFAQLYADQDSGLNRLLKNHQT